MNTLGLSRRQIEKQDYVDNAIYNLIRELADFCNKPPAKLDWDIEVISSGAEWRGD